MFEDSRRRVGRLTVAALTALMSTAAFVSPAAAYSSQESGLVGPYAFPDTSGDPMATCAYHDPGAGNWIWLDWFRVKAPTVYAADRNSSKRESRTVTFQFKIQKHMFGSPDPWKVVDASPIQRKTAWDDQAASFSAIKFYFTPNKTTANGQNGQFRVMAVIKWLKKDGSTEGSAKVWPSYYTKNSPYGPGTEVDYCSGVDTDG
jgi:hypothetical protein